MQTADADPGRHQPLRARNAQHRLAHLIQQQPLMARRMRFLGGKDAHLCRSQYCGQRVWPAPAPVLNHVLHAYPRQLSADRFRRGQLVCTRSLDRLRRIFHGVQQAQYHYAVRESLQPHIASQRAQSVRIASHPVAYLPRQQHLGKFAPVQSHLTLPHLLKLTHDL